VLNRKKIKNELPENFNLNNVTISNPSEIANAFNKFVVNIGPQLAS
jgi:hypothetical protein